MLFHVSWKERAGYTHEDQKMHVKLWENFQPPEGFEIKHIYSFSGGSGFGLVEAATPEILFQGLALWAGVILDYEVTPVTEVESAVASIKKAIAIREAV